MGWIFVMLFCLVWDWISGTGSPRGDCILNMALFIKR